MEKFRNLGFSDQILKIFEQAGFKEPTLIQEKTVDLALKGSDLIACSATGSGKTLAFCAPLIERLEKKRKVQALILSPTRELAQQVSNFLVHFSKKNFSVVAVYGGISIEGQIKKLRDADVVVGTPGRIIDHLERGTLILSDVKILVLDEFDRMLDMGFLKDVEKIIKNCPKERQTMLFSATSDDILHLAKKYTHNAIEVFADSYVDEKKLKQIYYDVQDGLKFSLLVHLLKSEKSRKVMIFCSTRKNVDFLDRNLKFIGINSNAIHGGFLQSKRSKIINDFHDERMNVLICTDVAARGLDIRDVSHVYNYDLPAKSTDYIHRIGRTARSGSDGIAINLVSSRDYENFNNILKKSSFNIEKVKTPYVKRVNVVKVDKSNFNKSDFRGKFSPKKNFRFSRQRDNRNIMDRRPKKRY